MLPLFVSLIQKIYITSMYGKVRQIWGIAYLEDMNQNFPVFGMKTITLALTISVVFSGIMNSLIIKVWPTIKDNYGGFVLYSVFIFIVASILIGISVLFLLKKKVIGLALILSGILTAAFWILLLRWLFADFW
jgi:hypothetical protein